MQDNATLEADREIVEEELQAVRSSMGARLRGLESAQAQARSELCAAEQRVVGLQAQLRQAVSERDGARGGARAVRLRVRSSFRLNDCTIIVNSPFDYVRPVRGRAAAAPRGASDPRLTGRIRAKTRQATGE